MSNTDLFAIKYVQEARFWELCNENNWPEDLKKQYREFSKSLKKFGAEIFPTQVIIGGFNPDSSHYDMDDKLEQLFGDDIHCDSESGNFFCYTSKRYAELILNFIRKEYPTWEGNAHEDGFMNPFRNWGDAKNYVKKNKLFVPEFDLDE